ncbi:MAG: glucose-6-phosphate isomerase [Deltaproteobacteria bacterium]|nr:glucose-6-phosphate isomerase [Deltaproteobacteria bacterium]
MQSAKTDLKTKNAEYSLNGFEPQVTRALDFFDETRFSERLLAKDASLWSRSPAAQRLIKNALGWLDMPEWMAERLDEITAFAEGIKSAGFKHAVVLGMGGSSLAPLVMAATFGVKKGYPELIVLDSTDPDALRSVAKKINPSKTLFIVSSKSGTTIEPLSFFEYFYAKIKDIKGERAGENFIAITDSNTPLEGFYRKYSMRRLFTNPSDIGGRYSALSYFGLVPAAVCGINISKLLWHANMSAIAMQHNVRAVENRGLMLGATLGALAKSGRDKATFFLSKEISAFGLWIEQLIAESTGKDGLGIVPVAGEPIGQPSSYGPDRVFIHIGLKGRDNIETRLKRLEEAGHPVLRFELKDIYELGGEFFRWETAIAAASCALAINPFDQPDVESAKKLTAARLAKVSAAKTPLTLPGVCVKGKKTAVCFGKKTMSLLKKNGLKKPTPKSALAGFFNLVNNGDYIGVLSYLNPFDAEVVRELMKLRKKSRSVKKSAVQMGYGPRYLHSTGQLHKGGADNGVFLMLVHGAKKETPIPGRKFGFSTLEVSQACGDMEALDAKGRRVALVFLKDAAAKTIKGAATLIGNAIGRTR